MKTPSILLIDDEPLLGELLEFQLRPAGFDLLAVTSARAALGVIQLVSPDLILSDICMPEIDGLDFLATLHAQQQRDCRPPHAVVMLTACDEIGMCVRAMQLGALDYLVKPVSPNALLAAIEKNLARQRDRVVEWESQHSQAQGITRQATEIAELSRRTTRMRDETLNSLVRALDAREQETRHHSQRTSLYALHLAKTMGLSEPECEIIRRGALVHDIGKIGLTDNILLKSGPLSPRETDEMRRHPETGHSILTHMSDFAPEAEIALGHHERFDGSGYPRGLSGNQIPFAARLFAVIDAFDAITSERPYRSARSFADAASEIAAGAGTQFDPDIVRAFLNVPPERWTRIAIDVASLPNES